MADYLALVDVAYAGGADWIRDVARVAETVLGEGFGTLAWSYDVSDPARPKTAGAAVSGADEGRSLGCLERFIRATHDDPHRYVDGLPAMAATSFSDRGLHREGAYAEFLGGVGVADALLVNALDPGGLGIMIAVYLPEERRTSRRRKSTLDRVAAHFATALRLRVRADVAAEAEPAAIFHGLALDRVAAETSADAEAGLRAAVEVLDRSRRSGREGDDFAWPSRVDATYTLVAEVSTKGGEYIVARKNPALGATGKSLTLREAQVLRYVDAGRSPKLVAYELGISPSTVRVLAARARKKQRDRLRT